MESENFEDAGESLNNLFGSFNINENTKSCGTKPKPRQALKIAPRISYSNTSSKAVESSSRASNSELNWRRRNFRNSETSSLRRTINSADNMRKWELGERRKKETGQSDMNKEFAATTKRLLLSSDNKSTSERASPVNYRNKHSNDYQKQTFYQGRRIKNIPRLNPSHLTFSLREVLDLGTEIPENVILTLLKKLEAFKRIIGENLSFEDVVLLLRVFDKICSSHFDENRGKLIIIIVNGKFLDRIIECLLLLSTQNFKDKNKNMYFWENPERFWSNLLILYENIYEFMPTTALEVLPKTVKATIISINDVVKYQKIQLSTNVKEKLEKFEETLTANTKRQIQVKNNIEVEEPPDDFRLMNIYPTLQEITTRDVPFIRPIIKNGAYQSTEHYLDVQFRLLKEDFTASLRNGICTYLEREENEQPKQQFDVYIHENVQFVAPHITKDKIALLLQYRTKIYRQNIEENAKRFIYGSLLCFTSNNFEDISFGTVVDNDIKFLQKGQLIVDIKEGHVDFNKNYIMVESTVYFEPYFQVLMALQKMDENNFPFKDYIIDVTSNTKPPKYISLTTVANLMPGFYKCAILSPETWPRPEQVGLNESQFKAFQSALSEEFCIIQGPPGTGKTYTTLKIVEFLLRNKSELSYSGPIFVICFTNHALDQFLEGILPFTKYLLRVGGQSKNPVMEQYNLKKYREILRTTVERRKEGEDDFLPEESKYDFSDYHHMKNEGAELYFKHLNNVEDYQWLLNAILSFNGVINFKFFTSYGIIDRLCWFSRNSNDKIVEWLMENDKNNHIDAEEKFVEEEIIEDNVQMLLNELQNERIRDDLRKINLLLPKHKFYSIKLKDYVNCIHEFEEIIKTLNTSNKFQRIMYMDYEKEIELLKEKMNYLTWRLQQCKTQEEVILPDLSVAPQQMKPDDRWNLYRYWLRLLRDKVCEKINKMDPDLRSSYRAYQEIAQLRDVYIMRKMQVVGMTTTGAAKHQKILQTLKFPIVIAEEAAEVLESHIVVSLTNQCQHLILIGDHQQLRPNTAQYNLAKKFNLEISLFERMVQNGIHCQQLNIQHRMRPEIAKIIVPTIYPNLDNSPSVENFPPVLGVTKNLFFINHWIYENYMPNNSSHKNVHEAKYMIRLAKYFIKQGYEPEEITILTTYNGQMYLLMEERSRDHELERVRIAVVDNFQGEENKIILLSLVRSNKEGNIGFLKIENRVCVALSRAKEGLFIMGNMQNLEQSSSIWPKVKKTLLNQDAIGNSLTLQCQIHLNTTSVKTWKDFEQVPEGGCSLACNTILNCSHICKLACHPYDRNHENYICHELCIKTCSRGHPCQDECYKKCTPCIILIKTHLSCGHIQSIPCSVEREDYRCRAKIEACLPCGHTNIKKCHEDPKYVNCSNPCGKQLDCEHECQSLCHIRNDPEHFDYTCMEPCKRIKKGCSINEHICPLKCFEECPPCEELVKKRRTTCTHKVKVRCNEEIDGSVCREKCRSTLPCGHHCTKLCFEKCGDCTVMVKRTLEVGLTITTRCSGVVKQLKCEHPGTTKCNEPCSENVQKL